MSIKIDICLSTWQLCIMKGREEMFFKTLMKNKMMFLNIHVAKMLNR